MHRRTQDSQFKAFDRDALIPMDDKALAIWQAQFEPDQAQYLLAEHEWQRRLADRQIAAARAANWRSIVGGIIGTLLGVVAGWLLSEARKPVLDQRSSIPVQTQREAGRQATIQNPIPDPPEKKAPAGPAPVQQQPNPNP